MFEGGSNKPSADPLLSEGKIISKLYDEESMLEIEPSIASGYVVLLGGATLLQSNTNSGGGESKTEVDGDINLGFLALTQGNVLDACFGVVNASRREDTAASRKSKEAKELLDDAARENEAIQRLGCQAYAEAFQAVLKYHDRISRLNCLTACFRTKKIHDKAQASLMEAFLPLAEAIAAAS